MVVLRPILTLLAAAVLVVPTHGALASGGGGEGNGTFVDMREIVVPIVDGDRADGRLRLKLVLRAADAEHAKAIEAKLPMLKERAVAAASEFARLRASPFVAVDAEMLSHAMTAAVQTPDHAVTGVLLVEVSARPV